MRENEFQVLLYNRISKRLEEEKVFNQEFKEKFYGTRFGRFRMDLIAHGRLFNKIYGYYQKLPSSVRKIQPFIEQYNIEIQEAEKPLSEFKNFNDFFTRRLKPSARPVEEKANALIAPADSRLLAIPITDNLRLKIKEKEYELNDLVTDSTLAAHYRSGYCLVFRLIPADYHRFCYFDNCSQDRIKKVKGSYYASSPRTFISKFYPPFHRNYREYCTLETENFGSVVQIEVGALTVGKVIQHHRDGGEFKRGEEKGYFEYGASTIILLFKKDAIVLDDDIQHYSEQNVETLVQYGSRIGSSINGM